MKKWFTVGFLLLATLMGGYGIWILNQPEDPYLARQVKQTAPSEDNFLLDFYPHISKVSRPNEWYHFPIPLGDTGPNRSLYSGPNQYPFFCMTVDSDLGQPVVDNQYGNGVPVLNDDKQIVGFSKDCGLPSQYTYYEITDTGIHNVTAEAVKNDRHGLLVRVEQGTINRFIYAIVMPVGFDDLPYRNTSSNWNKKLIYQFNGGSGIGFRQGRLSAVSLIKNQIEQLKLGYAVVSSSGNKTSYTYNMLLAEDTAARVKKQFVSLYGAPLYTIGIGGSGGGLAQYLIAQNGSGILDGLIPLYSYPDMITQTTYALDCDLLNNYFTFRAKDKSYWRDWENRQRIEGMNAINDFPQKAGFMQPINQLKAGFFPSLPTGSSECINGYFGLSSFINNPKQGFLRPLFSDDVLENTQWSYWQDLVAVFGHDEDGFANSTWDNEGVQYGLNALVHHEISVSQFIDLNRKIGGWKSQTAMAQEEIVMPFGAKLPIWLTLWGNQNISDMSPLSPEVAPRHVGSIHAMNQAYRSGQVFIGRVQLPIIDARHYLENELDMHHMSASFYSRLRIEQATGQHENQVIWVADKDFNPTTRAFEMMDKWLLAIEEHTPEGILKAKPHELTDTCFDKNGDIMASGHDVFDGKWNNRMPGECVKHFPMFSTSRIESGAPWNGALFKCTRMSIDVAVERGVYGDIDITPSLDTLKSIFPTGVCNYDAKDLGRPNDI
ncbi:DUF6351 family protein [Pseudoalteromonas xiamenensis]